MKLLLIPVGSAGDVHPFIGLGIALRSRGHSITFLTNGFFADLVRQSGFDFIELGTREKFLETMNDPRLWDPMHSFEFVMRAGAIPAMPFMFEKVSDFVRQPDSAVVAGSLAIGARLAREKVRFPFISLHLQPTIFQSSFEPPEFPAFSMRPWWPRSWRRAYWWLLNRILDAQVGPEFEQFRTNLGLPKLRDIVKSWWHSPDLVIGLFPEWFAAPQPDWPPNTRLTGFPLFDAATIEPLGPADEAWMNTGPAPVIFTAGSAMNQAQVFFRESLKACELMKCRAVFVTRYPEQLPPLPAFIRNIAYAPFSRLLPLGAAFVHHGGIGTTAQALRAGIPQLIAPYSHDQPDNGARCVRLGVGKMRRPKAYRAAEVAADLQELLLNPRFRESARKVAQRFENGYPLQATCELIESTAKSFST